MWLFLAFVLVPIIEIALFIQVGGAIGLWPTLAIVVLTALLGTLMMRTQGMSVLADLQRNLAEGGNPGGTLAHGAMILFAGALLLTPGFFTDAVGFSLLLPPVRKALIAWAGPRLATRMTVVQAGQAHARPAREDVIDGEFEPMDQTDLPDDSSPRGQSGWTRQP